MIDIFATFRKLWTQHVMWTRSFIISTAANLGDLQAVTARLLRNPMDFANVLGPIYGEDKAKRFSDLLTQHLMIAAQLVNAAKAGNTETVNEERKKWYSNADEIADFLAGLNPYWSKARWTLMLHDHLKITEEEAVERLSGQYAKDVALYDAIEDQALMMADYMADGILKQFSR
ncbi:acetylglutamate kinase [Caproiciproducens sp. AGMB10547]|uniref:Acetylglutamate kinase n=2 Tax=Caproiciproducens faecalis TaxID=2820301 RepID=A0ABS7DR99_9FIRM|nr:acetylglutamate kinase [Caproiciproducens faecalis]